MANSFPRITEVINIPLTALFNSGWQDFETKWKVNLNLPSDPAGTPPTRLVGKIVDKTKKPWEPGNFKAARLQKGVARKDMRFEEMPFDRELWGENFSWKFQIKQDFPAFRVKKNQDGTETTTELHFKSGDEALIQLGWSQNKLLMELVNGRKGVTIVPMRSGKNIVFREVGAPAPVEGAPASAPAQVEPEATAPAERLPEYPLESPF